MIKAILFDFGQTLVDASDGFRKAEKEAQKEIYYHLHLTNWEKFLSFYREVRKDYHNKCIFSRTAFWQKIYMDYGKKPERKLLKKWEDEYWQKVKQERVLFPETVKVLCKLSKGYKLAVITNSPKQGNNKTYPVQEHHEIKSFFDVIVVAGEGDIPPKPDPKPFKLCLGRLEIKASEAVFVGDDWNIDICGAKNTGIQPIWIQHHSVKRSWPHIKTDVPIITALQSLLDLESILHFIPVQIL